MEVPSVQQSPVDALRTGIKIPTLKGRFLVRWLPFPTSPHQRTTGAIQMKYFFAIFLPPVAVLLCGKPGSFLLNLILTLCGWVPGVVHAIIVVGSYNADKRTDRIVDALKRPDSGIPSLPQATKQGRPMKFVLFAGGLAFVVFCALAVTVAGLRNRMPTQTAKPATVVEEASKTATPTANSKLPAFAIISDKLKPGGKWRIVQVRLQEKVSEDDLKRISEDVNSAKPNKRKCTIFYFMPEQIMGDTWAKPDFDPSLETEKMIVGTAWAKGEFDPALKTEIMGIPMGVKPPKSDGEIVGQWEDATAFFLTLSRTKDGLRMVCTNAKDNSIISDELVNAQVVGNRVIIRPIKANEWGEYWILNEAKNLVLMNADVAHGMAAAIIKPTLNP